MRIETETDEFGLPKIDATHRYFSNEAGELLGESIETLRKWRMQGTGPRYIQAVPRGTVKYLGMWLIEFRRASVKEPSA